MMLMLKGLIRNGMKVYDGEKPYKLLRGVGEVSGGSCYSMLGKSFGRGKR